MNLCASEDCGVIVFGGELLCAACTRGLPALGEQSPLEEPRSIWTLKAGEQSPTEGELEVERLRAALNATRGEITAMRSRWLRIRILSRELLHLLEEMP